MHLSAEKFVKGMAPTTGHSILKKVQQAFREAQESDLYNIDQLNASLKDCEDDPEGDSGDDNKENDDFDTGDACGKQVAFILLGTLFLN